MQMSLVCVMMNTSHIKALSNKERSRHHERKKTGQQRTYPAYWREPTNRWKTCRFWERFLGAVEVLKLQVPKLHNSLEETQQWLTEGGVISAVKSFYFLEEHDALGGLEKVGTMLDKARYSNSLSSKLTAHLQRINRTDLIPYIQYDTKHGKGGI